MSGRRFRIHLATRVALLLVLAGLWWLNVAYADANRTGSMEYWDYGWPRLCFFAQRDVFYQPEHISYSLNKWALTCNVAAAVGILVCIGGLVEFVARRIVAARLPLAEDGATKRGRFRLHLSTALMMVLLVGGLLGLNTVPKDRAYNLRVGISSPNSVMYSENGWPLTFRRVESRQLKPDELSGVTERQYSDEFPYQGDRKYFNRAYMVHNACFALFLAAMLACACEFVIRGREGTAR